MSYTTSEDFAEAAHCAYEGTLDLVEIVGDVAGAVRLQILRSPDNPITDVFEHGSK